MVRGHPLTILTYGLGRMRMCSMRMEHIPQDKTWGVVVARPDGAGLKQ